MTITVDRPLVSASSWSEAAACRGKDSEEFFADSEKTQRLMQGLCRGCPSRTSCLTDILEYEEGSYYMRWGVSGGPCAVRRSWGTSRTGSRPANWRRWLGGRG